MAARSTPVWPSETTLRDGCEASTNHGKKADEEVVGRLAADLDPTLRLKHQHY